MVVALHASLAWIWLSTISVLGALHLCIYFPSSICGGHAPQRSEEQMMQDLSM